MSTLQVTNITGTSSISDDKGNIRSIPQNSKTAVYTTIASDSGKFISTTANVTVNGAIFVSGDAVTIYNDSASSITVLPGTGATMYLGGTSGTGNRTLAQRGVCTALCVGANTFVISGAGLT